MIIIHYTKFYRKDHQWTPGDAKNQQKIGIGSGSINTSGATWPNQVTMGGGSFGGVSLFIFNISNTNHLI